MKRWHLQRSCIATCQAASICYSHSVLCRRTEVSSITYMHIHLRLSPVCLSQMSARRLLRIPRRRYSAQATAAPIRPTPSQAEAQAAPAALGPLLVSADPELAVNASMCDQPWLIITKSSPDSVDYAQDLAVDAVRHCTARNHEEVHLVRPHRSRCREKVACA